jgi:hypothetical protein
MLVGAIGAVIVPLKLAGAGHGRLTVAVLVLIPAIAAGFYSGLGTPTAASKAPVQRHQEQVAASATATEKRNKAIGSVASMIDGLKSRLEKDPDDAGGWLLLAQSYRHLGQTEEAEAAYQRASALGKTDAKFEQSLATAMPAEVLAPVDVGPALRGRVTISADAESLVEPGDTVFIFAKESADHRMPVVAVRRPASELPIQFVLTDKDALVAGTSLAQFENLVITAKISRSGMATDVLSGLEAWSDPVSPLGDQVIELLLSTKPRAGAGTDSVGDQND